MSEVAVGKISIQGRPRVMVLANKAKPEVMAALEEFRPWLEERADIVAEPDAIKISDADVQSLPRAHFGLVLGGDGTLLGQGRRLVDLHMPLLGVNFGKLGFLAEFSLEDVKTHWQQILDGTCHTSERLMISVAALPRDAPRWGGTDEEHPQIPVPTFSTVAMNEVVITNGPANRLIEVELAIEPRTTMSEATVFAGDGVIVATPSGSTAYNLAAGGPIVSPGVEGLCVTAICPQSLAARPIVCHADNEIWLDIRRGDDGMALVVDGQESFNLDVNQQVLIRRYPHKLRLIHNPDLNYWGMLARKMRWAVRPQLHGE